MRFLPYTDSCRSAVFTITANVGGMVSCRLRATHYPPTRN
jgi:hypothetical protein